MDSIRKADTWAAKVWQENTIGWETRKQDYNYRKYLTRPSMQKCLLAIPRISSGIFLDLGCGDGSESRHITNFLAKHSNSGIFYGFDFQKNLVALARKKKYSQAFQMNFDSGELKQLAIKYYWLENQVDRLFSTFLIQELSDAEAHFSLASKYLKKGGYGIFLLLDPGFGNAMRLKGAVKINNELHSKHWRWAAEYPIVEEGNQTFYVPYFHRELEDYLLIAKKFFSGVQHSTYKTSRMVVDFCQKKKITPFYNHPGNVYFPEILEIPSAFFLIVTK